MAAFVLIVVFVGVLMIIVFATKDNDHQAAPTNEPAIKEPSGKSNYNEDSEVRFRETPAPEGEPLAKFACSIAGLSHHQNNIVLGGFIGFAVHEKNNPYDNLAIAIYNVNGGLMGYVPAKAHGEYLAYYPDKVPCYVVGYIDTTSDSRLTSKVYFVRIHSWQYAKDEIESLCQWLANKKHYLKINGYDEIMEQLNDMLKPDIETDNPDKNDTE